MKHKSRSITILFIAPIYSKGRNRLGLCLWQEILKTRNTTKIRTYSLALHTYNVFVKQE